MFKKMCSLMVLSFVAVSSFLTAEIAYEIQDIDTLQTHSSEAIALNNKGQILGWYNIKGSNDGKQFFVRNKNGEFFELPKNTPENKPLTWKYLTEEKAYGTFDVNGSTISLCAWDQKNGFVKLGNLPSKEISAINNAGQVLIKSITEPRDGKTYTFPVIWQNGNITKLRGLEGDLGIEGEESYGLAMNNKGEVVGQSIIYMSYKNDVYKQIHATKWINGKAIDLYKLVPKSSKSTAFVINDTGEILINIDGTVYFLSSDKIICTLNYTYTKINNNGFVCNDIYIVDKNSSFITTLSGLNRNIQQDYTSIWSKINKLINFNDKGEIIAEGETVYGEKHAVLLVPVTN